MTRIGKLLFVAALCALPLAMAGCPAEDDTTGVSTPRKSPTPTPSGGTGMTGKIGFGAVTLHLS